MPQTVVPQTARPRFHPTLDTRSRQSGSTAETPVVRRVVVIGLAGEGYALATALTRAGYDVVAVDTRSGDDAAAPLMNTPYEIAEDAGDAVALADLVVVQAPKDPGRLDEVNEAVGRGLTRGAVVCYVGVPRQRVLETCLGALERESGLRATTDFSVTTPDGDEPAAHIVHQATGGRSAAPRPPPEPLDPMAAA